MAKPGIKYICNILTLGVAGRVFGLYVLLSHGAYGAVPEQKNTGGPVPINRFALTVEGADGKVYTYHPSSRTGLIPQAPAAEGGLQLFFRNLAVGVSVPLVLLAITETLGWLKRLHNSRALKKKARQRARERKRLLRSIYAAQEELQALDDEIKNTAAGTTEQEQKALSASKRARKQELLRKLEDLRYQLHDMYEHSNSKFANAGDSAESVAAASGGEWSQDSSSRSRRVGDKQRVFGKNGADDQYAVGISKWIDGAEGKTDLATSREDSSDPAHSPEQEGPFKGPTAQTSDRRRVKKQLLVDKLARQNRVEVIRQLLDEQPGMPPEEVLRIAEKAAKPGL